MTTTNGGRPLRVAVIGSGPSGFYAAEALFKDASLKVEVDMIDRLPTPFGLVRGGVAPDHQKIKSVIKVYEKTAADPRLRLFGNVKLGKDITVADLKAHYDAVVYAVGAESDYRMNIPGEDLAGSHAATEFVGWYNSHPDYRDSKFDLSCESVAVVGIGNVAIDVARILAEDPEVLAKTDMAGYAVDALRKSKVKEVIMLGRRGPAQAAFSPAEIEEMGALHSADLVVRADEAELDEESKKDYASADINTKKNVDYLIKAAQKGEGTKGRKVRLRLLVSPVELIGEGGKVAAVRIEKNKLSRDAKGAMRPKGTGQFETLKIGMILRSVGYFGVAIPGVPFDEKKGVIPNDAGRVLAAAGGEKVPGQYVVGWAKRGPSGLIGTNRACSYDTAAKLIEDFKGKPLSDDGLKTAAAAEKLIRSKKSEVVTFTDWKRLDQLELEKGKAAGKIREKFSSVSEAVEALKTARV
ncbi:MAG: FAD-dependent oxidoreductase [Elusimicrobia bacterium]|nr:FAD-dependent oxidoreductase [Elusimicrobiota bacterium]